MADKKTHGRSMSGIELTDDNLQKMADEAEVGLDVTKLRRRPGRPPMGSGPADTLPVRLEPELRKAVDDRERGITPPLLTSSGRLYGATSR